MIIGSVMFSAKLAALEEMSSLRLASRTALHNKRDPERALIAGDHQGPNLEENVTNLSSRQNGAFYAA